jgi:hypothetical protein
MQNSFGNKDQGGFSQGQGFVTHMKLDFPAQFTRMVAVCAGKPNDFIEIMAVKLIRC